ncbi:MAG: aminotransferase class V-fold PLP-dependent enzyme [Caldilinea sp. CFX5]|nr:aminotransferase class V-fold PLP-dependent enzyme [Caldilinea sp. CFX5]
MSEQTVSHLRDLDRNKALAYASQLISEAWYSFDKARPTQPAIDDATRALLALPLPTCGTDPVQALDEVTQMLDQSLSQSRPRYFAFVGSSGLEMGVLADALMACHDVNLAVYAAAANLIEQQALRWVSELIGYPGCYGAFTSGGMLSNLTALSAAREHLLPGSRLDGVRARVALYASRDAHTSVARAVELLGFGRNALRDIAVDTQRRMEVAALQQAIRQDLQAGIKPLAIIANAGTTLAGAVDPLAQIAEVAAAHQLWLHVDGAYGAPAAAVKPALFAGWEAADSLAIDAHKWLYLPKACGIVLVRNRAHLQAAFGHEAAYIPHERDVEHPVEWTLEYSRPLRALKLWLALRTYGADAFRCAIAENLAQARLFAQLVRQSPALELLYEPQLSVVLFRHHPQPSDMDEAALNQHNQRLAHQIQQDGRVYLASATVDGQACLRACFVNYRTQTADLHALVEVVQKLGERLAGGQSTPP